MVTHNIDLGYRPRPGQARIHNEIGSKRFAVIIAHRRFGKSVAMRFELIHRALSDPKFEGAYIAPTLTQARRVFWGPLKETCSKIPGVECRETDMVIRMPSGSTIRCLGSDNADGIRGLGFSLVVLDEFADFEASVLPMVIMPTLAGRNGGLLIIGTIKGHDPLTELYEKHINNPEWACFKFDGEETGVLDADELKMLKDTLTEQQYRLEIRCDYSAGSPDQLISGNMVDAAMALDYPAEIYCDAARVMAVDIARQGDDLTVIARRQGLQVWDLEGWHSPDLMVSARKIREAFYAYKPDELFIDGGGLGAGVVDALRDWGIPVTEVQFGGKASDVRFLNVRAEMYLNLYHWLRRGGRLPKDAELKRDLTTPRHFTNDKGQTQLESKDEMRSRGMKSPDRGDAVAMTLAYPVHPKAKDEEMNLKPKHDWDPVWS